jgi:predicted metalloprotease with PDZ domain
MEATENTKSLQDVMLVLYNDFYKKGKGYSEHDILSIVHNVSGKDFDAFFTKYVYGLEEYEEQLKYCFNYLGIELIKKPATTFYERYLGFKVIDLSGIKKVSLITPYSPAWKAKLSPNDEIIAVNGFQIKNDLNQWLSHFNKKNDKLTLNVISNSEIKQIEFGSDFKREYFEIYALEIVNSSNETQKNNFKLWSKKLHK